MNELALVLVDNGSISKDSVELWQKRFSTNIGPDGLEHQYAPWDPWLNYEWRLKPRNSLEEIRDYYDSDCHVSFQDHISGAWGASLPDEIFYKMDLKGLKILEFGCGAGKSGRAFVETGANVSFSDTSPRLLKGIQLMCKKRGFDVQTFDGETDFPSNYFDIVLSCDVFEHLLDPMSTLKRLVSSIKVGGFLFQKTFFGSHELSPYHLDQNLHFEKEWFQITKACNLDFHTPIDNSKYDGLWKKMQ